MGRNGEDQEGSLEDHIVKYRLVPNKISANCKCGAEWSHPIDASEEDLKSIFESHKKYFNNKTEVL